MKKLFTLVALTLVSIWGANAQSFGVRGGGVLSGLNGETINESDMKPIGGFTR